ncbi:polyprenyl synthetase family protein [Streptomyces triculaminicus]|uniref:polyprenyl synthetase family protein n=1 Tax=Streptomyces triculaminicus TaxID=2816232 RepID=UPI0033F08147
MYSADETIRFVLPHELRRMWPSAVTPSTAELPSLAEIRTATDAAILQLLDRKRPQLQAVGLAEHEQVVRDCLLNERGKRMRAAFCYWGWRGAGGTGRAETVYGVAAALEIVHSAFLIQDDIIDRSELRRGRPTVHRHFAALHTALAWQGAAEPYGDSTALVVGDLCLAWGSELLAQSTPAAVRQQIQDVYDHMCQDTCLGEMLEVQVQADRLYEPDRCRAVTVHKTGRYVFSPALLAGAALADAPPAVCDAYREFGDALGEAYQFRDDLCVFGVPEMTGKSNMDDLRDGKPTVLFATALEAASPAQRDRLLALYGRPGLDEAGADEVRRLLHETEAPRRIEDKIRALGLRATRALDAAPITPAARSALEAFASYVLSRSR